MREPSPSDRMQLVGMGDLVHPGCCKVCGSGNCERGYIDLGVYIDYEGQLYLCVNCITEAAEIIGCLTQDESLFLRNQNEELVRDFNALRSEYETVNGYFTQLVSAIGPVAQPIISALAGNSSVSEQPAVDVVDEQVTESADSNKSESPEPVKVSRRGDTSRVKSGNGSDAGISL